VLNHSITQHSIDWKEAFIPTNDAQRKAIREQLDHIIESPMFKKSKRCTLLLRFLVEKALNGHGEHIKERTIGFEVFNRDADYDTYEDPVVRNTAVEVRKRLAQYYYDFRHEVQILIDLPTRGYMPEFRMPVEDLSVGGMRATRSRWLAAGLVLAALVAVAAGAVLLSRSCEPSRAMYRFWNPVLKASASVTVCVGSIVTQSGTQISLTNPAVTGTEPPWIEHSGAYPDATALSRLVGLLMANKKPLNIRSHIELKMEDFKARPVIVLGGVNNQWTRRVVGELRYSVQTDKDKLWISDKLNLQEKKWSVARDNPQGDIESYAIISRVSDPQTGGIVVSIAGLSALATAAAAEFLSEPSYMKEVTLRWPKSWDLKNIQIVIATKQYRGSSGPPSVEAMHFW
jgi:hypothetical protein